jgi:hypothetical protein
MADRIQDWLLYYPEKLLTVQDFIFLALHDEIFINRANFDEKEILNGRFANAYRNMKDSGKLQLFDFELESQYLIERVKEIKVSQKFYDPNNIFENDLCSIVYCDQHLIPVLFSREEFYNRDFTSNRDALNFFSNFSRAFILYSQYVEMQKETGLINPQEYQDFFLSFSLILDLPNIISNNTPESIDRKKFELEPVYKKMGDEFKSEIDFSNYVCVNLVHDVFIMCSPSDFFNFIRDLDLNSFHDNYLKLQKLLDSPQLLIEYENAMNEQNQRSLIGNWNVRSTRFSIFKHRVLNEKPPLHGRYNQSLPCNRRIKNKHWLFTDMFFGTTLKAILSGKPL